ncbi:oligopeptide/dipeptide ABC transporter ATP-binding protein [Haloferax volcanii]|uniref:ATP-binding cassette domain-containing protein n=3 Tax=Haloferax volcanii TaxID=2246 RepID=A0A8T5CRD1_HALVO|nr:oligopeptide/dipeptide ABC transporter ATP-binding protein [Haloferax volcanii]ADE03999.1 ABC-type transport system chimeric fusion protein (permease/ATPase) (probable substrate dipeptide/oligopeptide) [Haloferax volcanii DS2]ELY35279.1 putative dipeptides/oligopeptides ABC transporter ATP-binding protein [Haloferax volcanii DS2]MBS8120882.1 ATP-binding cassette domain-containing protein [Haloferax volcanii]MBS8125919.1 ATP-binding cassette domain-containing protein [Haloferax volcanii]MBS8
MSTKTSIPFLDTESAARKERLRQLKRGFRTFAGNKLSLVGLAMILTLVAAALLAPYIAPFPEHAGAGVYFDQASEPPSATHLMGTDTTGRDIFSRVLFGARLSLSKLVRDALSTGAKADHRKRAIEMLGEVEISAPERVFESYPVELSGGMRQRVFIAIALLSEPDLLIADEPGTALDVTTEAKVLDLLDELVEERDTSVLYITHDLGVAREVSDRINVMYAGEIVEQAPTADLFANPQHPYTRGLLEIIPTLSTGIGDGIEGHLPDYTDPPAGCRFADRCPHAEPVCHEAYPYPRQTGSDHAIACHLFDGLPARERHESLAAERVDIGTAPWLAAGGDAPSGDAPGDISADGGTDQ